MTKLGFTPDRELKEEFLNDMNNEFSEAITHVAKSLLLTKITKTEVDLGKDFFNFSPREIETTLRDFRAKSLGSLNTYWSILCKYLVYANERRDNVDITIVKMLSSKDLEQYVNKVAEKDRYKTRDELHNMLLNGVNPQDQAMLVLLFEGVSGKAYSEIVNLKVSDIDIEAGIIKTARKTVKIEDKRSLFIINEAIKQEFYITDNKYHTMVEFCMDSPYFIKKIQYKNTNDCTTPVSVSRLKLKIQQFTEEIGRAHLTGKTVYNSGLAERFMNRFGYEVNPSDVSTEDIRRFLLEEDESISPANLRSIVRNIQEKLGLD